MQSPTMVKVTLELLQRGAGRDFNEALRTEHAIHNFLLDEHADFQEGAVKSSPIFPPPPQSPEGGPGQCCWSGGAAGSRSGIRPRWRPCPTASSRPTLPRRPSNSASPKPNPLSCTDCAH